MNWYGFFVGLGILVGALVIEEIRKRKPFMIQVSVYDIFPWVVFPGLVGARLYHVLDYWNYYSKNLIEIFFVWQGGLGIFGGIIGGIIGLFIYSFLSALRSTRQKFFSSKRFLMLLDLAALGLAVGQAIGRFGNYFNQELYGLPTNLPWGIYIRPENRLLGYESFEKFHPLFLYESLGCLVIFLILLVLLRSSKQKFFSSVVRSKRLRLNHKASGETLTTKKENFCWFPRKTPGVLFFLYLFLYSFLRFWLEFLRPEGWLIKTIRVNQILTVFLIIFSVFYLYKNIKKHLC